MAGFMYVVEKSKSYNAGIFILGMILSVINQPLQAFLMPYLIDFDQPNIGKLIGLSKWLAAIFVTVSVGYNYWYISLVMAFLFVIYMRYGSYYNETRRQEEEEERRRASGTVVVGDVISIKQ